MHIFYFLQYSPDGDAINWPAPFTDAVKYAKGVIHVLQKRNYLDIIQYRHVTVIY